MKLYHLSFDVEEPLTRTFVPRVPEFKMEDENSNIPRICFSHNVLGCLNAIPELDYRLGDNWEDLRSASRAVLFCMETKEFPDAKFLESQALYEQGLVPDALVNQECWCLSPITMTGEMVDFCPCSDKVRTLYSAKEENRDFVYSVIDRVCEEYARENKAELDTLSLTYIMNYYFQDADLDWDIVCDLDSEFCNIANSPELCHLIDAFVVYPDFYVNDVLHSLEDYLEGFDERSLECVDSLDEQIGNAEVKREGNRSGRVTREAGER